MILSYTMNLPMSQLQTQQLMMSLIRSYIEYLVQTYNIFVLILYSKLMRNVAAHCGFWYNLMMILENGLLFWATLYIYDLHHDNFKRWIAGKMYIAEAPLACSGLRL